MLHVLSTKQRRNTYNLKRRLSNHFRRERTQAIIETTRHWKHYLTGRHSLIKTDQRSVAYMFNTKQRRKIKIDKIMHWRIELSCYNFEIVNHPGAENIACLPPPPPPGHISSIFLCCSPSSPFFWHLSQVAPLAGHLWQRCLTFSTNSCKSAV